MLIIELFLNNKSVWKKEIINSISQNIEHRENTLHGLIVVYGFNEDHRVKKNNKFWEELIFTTEEIKRYPIGYSRFQHYSRK